MNDLEGRTAIVTGAASGIGYAVAKALHRDGMQVLLGDIDAERIADATDAIGDTERGVRVLVPRILATGEEGHVVNIGSAASLMAMPTAGIGATTVFPGLINTGMSPLGEHPVLAADAIVAGIRNNEPYVFTDPHFAADVRRRSQEILDARKEQTR